MVYRFVYASEEDSFYNCRVNCSLILSPSFASLRGMDGQHNVIVVHSSEHYPLLVALSSESLSLRFLFVKYVIKTLKKCRNDFTII